MKRFEKNIKAKSHNNGFTDRGQTLFWNISSGRFSNGNNYLECGYLRPELRNCASVFKYAHAVPEIPRKNTTTRISQIPKKIRNRMLGKIKIQNPTD